MNGEFKKILKEKESLDEHNQENDKKIGRIIQKEHKPKVVDEFLKSKQKIIKQDGISKITTLKVKKIDKEVFSAHQLSKEIIHQAETQAEEIKKQAIEEKEKAIKEGYEKGYQEGLAQVSEIILLAKQQREKLITNLEPQLVKLSIKIAEKIIARELKLDEWTVINIVTQALQPIKDQQKIIIFVNPEDLKKLEIKKSYILSLLSKAKDIEIRANDEIKLGGCIIETEAGKIDAQLQTQLKIIEKALSM